MRATPQSSGLAWSRRLAIGCAKRGRVTVGLRWAVPMAAAFIAAAGCVGSVGSDGDGSGSPPPVGTTGSGSPGSKGSSPTPAIGSGLPSSSACRTAAIPSRMPLLSRRHYENAVRDLLDVAPQLDTSAGGAPREAFFDTRGEQPFSLSSGQGFQQNAEALAAQASQKLKELTGCTETDRACVESAVLTLAARAFRRPLTTDEEGRLRSTFAAGERLGGSPGAGFSLTMEAILQSPSFLYRHDLASGDARAPSAYEVASQVAFFLLDSLPDTQLWQAARDGSLATAAGLRQQVDRLLADVRVKQNLTRTMLRWLDTYGVSEADKNDPLFNEAMASSMIRETETFVDDVIWKQQGRLVDLLTSRRSFIDGTLAGIYGVQGASGAGPTPVTLPESRSGVLTQASLMTHLSDLEQTSTVFRGLFVTERLLCVHIPPPPPNVDPGLGAPETATGREKALFRMRDAVCGSCHGPFEQLGLLFEHYDELGRYRDRDKDKPIDSSYDLVSLGDLDGPAANIIELAPRLADSRKVHECLSAQFLSYAVSQDAVTDHGCVAAPIADGLTKSGSMIDFFRAVALSPTARLAK